MQGTDAFGGISPGGRPWDPLPVPLAHTEITFRIAAVQIRCALLSRNHLPASTHALIASCSLHLSIAVHAKLAILCDRVCGRGGAFLVNHADRLNCTFPLPRMHSLPAAHCTFQLLFTQNLPSSVTVYAGVEAPFSSITQIASIAVFKSASRYGPPVTFSPISATENDISVHPPTSA
jgi:hypothetical protein